MYRITLFFLVFLWSTIFAFSQQLPIQGKLIENNQVVNGQRTISLSLKNGAATIWTETHSNVSIIDGVYAIIAGEDTPLPDNLFDGVNSLDLEVRINGTLIQTTKVYPPIEQDPTVPNNLKDGISWTEITGKPLLCLLYTSDAADE